MQREAGAEPSRASLSIISIADRATLLRLGHPLQSCQPEIMAAVHPCLVALAQGRRILPEPGLIHHDTAYGAVGLQIPGVIELGLAPGA